MAGIITITLPFGLGGGFTITTAGSSGAPTAINSGAGSDLSYNWSGYEATGGSYTGVCGTWTIPTVADATSTQADATWIGIGGVSSQDLIQAGTQTVIDPAANNGSDAPTYEAWVETLPQATQQIPLTVSPGDSISVSLAQTAAATAATATSAATPTQWSVSISDNTTGQSYQTTLSYNSSLSSAEWIEEMPSDGSGFVPLDNFGSVSFTGATAIVNGDTTSLAGADAQGITMVNHGGTALATPSSLGSDSESFTVTRTSAAPTGGNTIGVGRGWRRTGVGVQGFGSRPGAASTSSSGGSGIGGGSGNNGGGASFGGGFGQWRRIFQWSNGFMRNGVRNGWMMR